MPGVNGATIINTAVSGRTVATMLAQYEAEVRPYAPSLTNRPAVVFILGGNNDIGQGADGATVYNRLRTWCAMARSDGFYIVVSKVMPTIFWPPGDDREIARLSVNGLLVGDSTIYDALYNSAAAFPDPSQEPPYLDGTHLAAAGNAVYAAQINALARAAFAW